MVVQVTIDPARTDEAQRFLEEQVVPRVKQAPGFQAGYWLRRVDGGAGRSVVLFDTLEHAQAGVEMVRSQPPEPPVTLESVEAYEVAAQA